MREFRQDIRFQDIEPFTESIPLSSPTMHGDEMEYIKSAYESGWVTTAGEHISSLEGHAAAYTGVPYAVAVNSGTSALHLAVKLAAESLYCSSSGVSTPSGMGVGGALFGRRVFCSDLTFAATVNPVVYEGGEPVFIDSEYSTWNMDPKALEQAFEKYPDVRIVVLAHLYGTPAKMEQIKDICIQHGALLIEDAAEGLGATYRGRPAGSFGDYGVVSFNGNKIITGSCGGMLLTHDSYSARKARKWSMQSREDAPWYQHCELGYNYRMSNVAAGIVRGQWKHLEGHIIQKKRIYEKYAEGFKGLPVTMNPTGGGDCGSNYWLSCLLIDKDAMCKTEQCATRALYLSQPGHTCPAEILDVLNRFHAEGRPIWKPMHLQPMYRSHGFVSVRATLADGANTEAVSSDIFRRGICLPSDIKMTPGQQEQMIELVRRCFR